LKNHTFGWSPVTTGFWFRWWPARSVAWVVTSALYSVPDFRGSSGFSRAFYRRRAYLMTVPTDFFALVLKTLKFTSSMLPDWMWLVEIALVLDPDLVPPTVAEALGIK
jgi:hypothetical protein